VGVSSVVAGILGRVRRQEDIRVEVNEYVYLPSVEVVFFYVSIRVREGNIDSGGCDLDCGSVSAHLSLAHFEIEISISVTPPS
jgi:hypothetical protein